MSDWTENPAKTDADRHTIRLARYAAREEFTKWLARIVIAGALLFAALRFLH